MPLCRTHGFYDCVLSHEDSPDAVPPRHKKSPPYSKAPKSPPVSTSGGKPSQDEDFQNMTPLAMARRIKRVLDVGKTQRFIAQQVGISASSVALYLQLLALCEQLQTIMNLPKDQRSLSVAVAAMLSNFPPEQQIDLAEKIKQDQMDTSSALRFLRRKMTELQISQRRGGRPRKQ